MLHGIQLLGIFFGLIMMYLTFYNYKRNTLTEQSLSLWLVIWFGIILVAILPQTFYGIMEDLSIKRTIDFIALLGFAFFAVIIFYLHSKINKMQEKMERLVRNMAMKEVKAKSSSQKKTSKKLLRIKNEKEEINCFCQSVLSS